MSGNRACSSHDSYQVREQRVFLEMIAIMSGNRACSWRCKRSCAGAHSEVEVQGNRLTVPLQVADTGNSVRQGTTGPRQGNKSHLLRFRQRDLNLLSACISGSQALMKGDCHDHIEASCSSFP